MIFGVLYFQLSGGSLGAPLPGGVGAPDAALEFVELITGVSMLGPGLPTSNRWPGREGRSIAFFVQSPLSCDCTFL